MHVVAERVGDDRSRRDGQDVAAVGGDVLAEAHRHIVAVGPHGGLVGGAGGGVGQGGLAARGNAIHQFGEGDDEIAQTLHVALGGIDCDLIIERLAVIGDRVIEVQLAHGLVHGVEDDRTSGNLQGVVSGLVDLVREVDQHVEAHIIHFGLESRARRVVGENGLAAVVDFAHILRERDGEILQALHVALGRVDGDLIVERLQIALDAEPECQGQEPLSVDLERAFGQVQEIVARCGAADVKIHKNRGSVGIGPHGAFYRSTATFLQGGDGLLVDLDWQVGECDSEVLQASHDALGRSDLQCLVGINSRQHRCAVQNSHHQQ